MLDTERMQATWDQQQKHVACIQDMAGMSLYRETGQTTRGGVVLTKYRCHRGSTSLESFHRHLAMFVPGTSANAVHLQAYLLDGLVRWNEDRAVHIIATKQSIMRHGIKCFQKSGIATSVYPPVKRRHQIVNGCDELSLTRPSRSEAMLKI